MLLLSVISLLCLTLSSPLYIVLSLGVFVVGLAGWLCHWGLAPTLLSFLVVMVYLGSIIILNSYVCAVLPNVVFPTQTFSLRLSALFIAILLFALYLFLFPLPSFGVSNPPSHSLSQFFFSPFGALPLFMLLLLILTVLLSTSNTRLGAPLRRATQA